MTAYLQAALGLDEAAAGELRRHYWQRYGATLLGLIKHHGTDPHHFLRSTHDFPDLERAVVRERGLRSVLTRLRGRRIVFSNGPTDYARAVLRVLRVADLFDQVYTIEHTRFRPKPDAYGFLLLLGRERVSPSRCIMVEDSLDNLRTAKKLGMTTVWVSEDSASPSCVDVKVRSLRALPGRLRHL
ncbi:MAG: HAD-IA family hydrolase [Burkholderiales bacterium]|nr:HAD-IA family hydrolase [Burkholderiales bacterium]